MVIALGAAACGGAPPAPPLKPVADVKQLMQFVVEPAADAYWDGVGTIVDASGVTEFKPETSGEWDALVNHAYVIAETGNLMMLGGRPRDGGEWMRLSRALVDVGGEVYEACTNCHAQYANELGRPNTQP